MAVMKKSGNKKETPAISTASLPDVIFMILFFFMVSTTMREQEVMVRYKLPQETLVSLYLICRLSLVPLPEFS